MPQARRLPHATLLHSDFTRTDPSPTEKGRSVNSRSSAHHYLAWTLFQPSAFIISHEDYEYIGITSHENKIMSDARVARKHKRRPRRSNRRYRLEVRHEQANRQLRR